MEMNDMNSKLLKIKKSCHTGKIVSSILTIVLIVGCVCSVIGGIALIATAQENEPRIQQLVEQGTIDPANNKVASVRMFSIESVDPEDWESDIPAVQKELDEHPYSFIYGMYLFMASGMLAVIAVLMKLVSGTFALIEKEENPFTDKVIKRVTIVLGVVSGLLLMSSGAGMALLGALVTWVVYTVLDYGRTLQIQADETL